MKSPVAFLFAGLWLLASCRSERAAFQFQSATQKALPYKINGQAQRSDTLAVTPVTAVVITRHGDVQMQPLLRQAIPEPMHHQRLLFLPARRRIRVAAATASLNIASGSVADDDHDLYTLMTVAGVALMIGAVVLGFVIGGWTGLGVGVVLFLLGAFLNLMGIFFNGNLP